MATFESRKHPRSLLLYAARAAGPGQYKLKYAPELDFARVPRHADMAKICTLVRVLVLVGCMNNLSGGFALAASASPISIGMLRLEREMVSEV